MHNKKNKPSVSESHKRNQLRITGIVLIGLAWVMATGEFRAVHASAAHPGKEANKKAIIQKAFKLQMPFIVNEGQISDEHVRFYAKTFGGKFYVTKEGEMVYSFPGFESKVKAADGSQKPREIKSWILKEKLIGSSSVSPRGVNQAETKVNYFIGNDKSKWKTGIKTYNSLSLGEIYKGITLSLKAHGNNVEKVFIVQPGADPKIIKLTIEGTRSLKVNDEGELETEAEHGLVRFSKPKAYQEKNGKRDNVQVAYRLEKDTYGFKVGDYDMAYPLIIDPVLNYSTYLGGGNTENAWAVAVDAVGNVYVTGFSSSTDFPTENPIQGMYSGDNDAFVTKLSADGSALVYSTYLGGSNFDIGWGIAVDAVGNAYVTGGTESVDFPIQNAIQAANAGGWDTYVTKLSAGGSLVYSTYLGGSDFDYGVGIAVDAVGNAYVAGGTDSVDFPIQNAIQAANAGGRDTFVMKLDPLGSAIVYSTYLGGSDNDLPGLGIAVDAVGNAYVTGETASTDFPTDNPIQGMYGGDDDAFVTKISADGSALVYSTYLGGSNFDIGYGITVDGDGNAYVSGYTGSADFPIQNAIQDAKAGYYDAFVAKLNANGAALVYSTYLGGSTLEGPCLIGLDGAGNAYVAGGTDSMDFPTTTGAFQESFGGGTYDVFVAKIIEPDSLPPYTTGQDPVPGATNVAINTNITIHVRDDGAGVNLSTIIMTVEGTIVYDGADPGSYPNTTLTGDLTDYTLIYDPPTDFGYEQEVNVTVDATDLAGNVMSDDTYSFMTEPQSGNPWDPVGDDDEDDIPNGVEQDLLGTDPNVKTLFVRPKRQGALPWLFDYWAGFIALFPDARPGFADIPAFTNAGIEIVVIGDGGNPYAPMRDFAYDPALDANHPPCDILELVYKAPSSYCAYAEHNEGHTYFEPTASTWYWDTKGYVPNDQTTEHYQQHRYFTPGIYPFPLDNYFTEGAYPSIQVDQLPVEAFPCTRSQCYETNHSSPMNLDATDPVNGLPDSTVEFNVITFDSGKQITYVGASGNEYDRDTVLRRTVTHEMGHGLLAASEEDHCSDSQCIMYGYVVDWEMGDFGPGDCTHKPGGAKDIRARGVVHNSIHY